MRPLAVTWLGGLPSIDREETWRDVGMNPPTGVIEKEVLRGVEHKTPTTNIYTGSFDYTAENRTAIRALSDALSIRLRERMREDLGGTYSVRANGGYSRDPTPDFSFSIAFGSDPERAEELAAVVFEEIERFKTEGPSEDDITKVKEQQRRSRETALRENGYWRSQLLSSDRYELDPRRLLSYEQIESITVEMVREAASRYLPTDNYVQVVLKPEAVTP